MTTDPPLNLRGIANLLQVGFWRVRAWRMRGGDGTERRYVLPYPDVSDLPRQPLWSTSAITAWAEAEGLWPPGTHQQQCPGCSRMVAPVGSGLRTHRTEAGGTVWCDGGGRHSRQAQAQAQQTA